VDGPELVRSGVKGWDKDGRFRHTGQSGLASEALSECGGQAEASSQEIQCLSGFVGNCEGREVLSDWFCHSVWHSVQLPTARGCALLLTIMLTFQMSSLCGVLQ